LTRSGDDLTEEFFQKSFPGKSHPLNEWVPLVDPKSNDVDFSGSDLEGIFSKIA
jgi:hypothetical protein